MPHFETKEMGTSWQIAVYADGTYIGYARRIASEEWVGYRPDDVAVTISYLFMDVAEALYQAFEQRATPND